MTPRQQSILERYGIQNPPEWSGMTGQGAESMYSIGGRWMKAGQTHPSGFTVGQYDPKSKSLVMSIHGVNIPVGMKASSVLPYENPRSMALNDGNMSDSERGLINETGAANFYTDPTQSLFSLKDKLKMLNELRDKAAKTSGSAESDRENFYRYYNLSQEINNNPEYKKELDSNMKQPKQTYE